MAAGSLLAFGIMTSLRAAPNGGRPGQHLPPGEPDLPARLPGRPLPHHRQAARLYGNEHPTIVPTNAYPAADGYVNIAASTPAHWKTLCDMMDKPDWMARWPAPRDRSKDRRRQRRHRGGDRDPPRRPLGRASGGRRPALRAVYDIAQMFDDPQVRHLHSRPSPTLQGRRQLHDRLALNIDGAIQICTAAEPTGVHTDEVLDWLGYSAAEIERLRDAGVTGP